MPGSRWTDELLDEMRTLGDPVADVPVGAVLESGGVERVNAVMRTLVRADQPVPAELPDELEDYLNTTLPLPDWVCEKKIRRAQDFFEVWGVQISVCLFCASLPSSYAAAKGVKVLYLTARLDTDARRRIMETGQFLMDVLSPGGLSDKGNGRRTIQRVRLMHAAVRHLINARTEVDPQLWDPDWGTPINQEDLAGTLLAFSYVVAEPMRRLGIPVSDEDADAYLHLWNVIGHELGIRDEMLVKDLDDATDLVAAIRRRHFAPSPEGQDMTLALLNLLDELTPFERFDRFVPALVRHLINDDVADMLLVPESPWVDDLGRMRRISRWLLVNILGRAERDTERYRVLSKLAEPFGRELLEALFAVERGGERAPFAIPDQLKRTWLLSD
jgi:hypothetical protein